MNLNIDLLQEKFGKSLIIKENLSKYSWFNLGGPADIFFRPQNKDQLIEFLKDIRKNNFKQHILGAGSNTLIRDAGVKGVVIKLSSKFSDLKLLEKDTIEVGAAALDKQVSDFAKKNDISKMEFLSCIPGSIGGAITMNSGCYGSDVSKILLSIKVIDDNGKEKEIKKDEIKFFYRGTNISKKYIILSAVLKGTISSKQLIEKKQEELIERKKESQPSQVKTGGSTFKNPIGQTNKKVWELIRSSVPNEINYGDAIISEKHANFFVNQKNAKSIDMKSLINFVKKKVKDQTGVKLELEIVVVE